MDIVLVEPQIPQNTGSIARSCAATKTPLCIVGKPAFEISDKTVRRAGLDYWPYVNLSTHQTWESYLKDRHPRTCWLFSKFGKKIYYDVEFHQDDALVFGGEVKGLGKEMLARYSENILIIPMQCPEVRSLNLSNAVSVALYEARRQLRLDEGLLDKGLTQRSGKLHSSPMSCLDPSL